MIYGLETEFGFFPDDSEACTVFDSRFDDRFHLNGGRIYFDQLAHPEYATPECTNPLDLVIWDKAGELIVSRLLADTRYRLFKNNRDSQGNTWGCHENYSPISRKPPNRYSTFDNFLISRAVITGSGRLESQGYGLSQKNKGVFYAMKDDRLHVSEEDANVSEISTFLKAGTTGLVLRLIKDGFVYPGEGLALPGLFLHREELKYPDGFRERIGIYVTAQRRFLEAAKQYRGQDPITDKVLVLWEYVLDRLQENFMDLSRDLDWVIKLKLLLDSSEDFGWDWNDSRMKDLDIEYHDIDREHGLFYRLQSAGEINRLVTDEQIEAAVENPPEDTRAWLRGQFVRNVGDVYEWDQINDVYIEATTSKSNFKEKLFDMGEEGINILKILGVSEAELDMLHREKNRRLRERIEARAKEIYDSFCGLFSKKTS